MKKAYIVPELSVETVEMNCILNLQSGGSAKDKGITDADIKELQEFEDFAKEKLGFEFHDINLLVTALTHRSYVNEHKHAHIEHNERLEFLGDAVLELVTSDVSGATDSQLSLISKIQWTLNLLKMQN